MAEARALTVLPDDQLNLAGDISICIGSYNDVDSRRAAMASLLAFVFLSISDHSTREVLRIAALNAGLTVETL
jgi:hypothetical protein